MTKQHLLLISFAQFIFAFAAAHLVAQNPYDQFAVGNEWIDRQSTHYEFYIEADDIYDIVLEPSFFKDDLPCQYKIYRLGVEVPSHKSVDDLGNHHIVFYGQKNRGEIDEALYEKGNQLNPDFNLFSDKAAYYLVTHVTSDCNRLITADESESNLNPLDYYTVTEKQLFTESHFKAKVGQNLDLQSSEFDVAEGFGSPLSNDHLFLIRTTDVYVDALEATLTIRFAGNASDHDIDVLWNDNHIDKIQLSGYGVVEMDYSISADKLLQTNQLTIRSNNGDLDKITVASVSLSYPQNAKSLDNNRSIVTEPSDSFRSLSIDPSTHGVMIDIDNQIIYQSTSDIIKLTPSDRSSRLFIAAKPEPISSDLLTQVEFKDYSVENPSYIILTHPDLRSTEMTGQDEVQAYATYRSSEEGGGHEVLIVDVNDLYRQFAFGQKSHPLAIKQFAQYVSDYWQSVEGLFIIGKGRDYYTRRFEESIKTNPEYVPTYGSPGSDNILTSDKGSIAPLFPVGRLAAQSAADIKLYLDKIKIHEQQDPSIIDPVWRKRILHLSGGSSDIVNAVAFFLKDLEELIEESSIGASVETFSKTSAAPIQPAQTKDLLKRINEGVSLITFLGHSSPGTFDFSLEEPAAYDNIGQLPLIISLGCHSGNIHSEGFGLSEQFVLEPEKGAIAFLASSSSNYLDVQYLTGRILYLLIGDNFHNQPVGRAMQEILILTDQVDNESLALNEQFTLHGDPLIQLGYTSFPDLQVDESSAITDPPLVTSTLDSFLFSVDILNAGKVLIDSVSVSIQHINEDDTVLYQELKRIAIPSFATTMTVNIPSPGLSGIGENRIQVIIDPENEINEGPLFAEENNEYINESGLSDYRFLILDQAVRAVYPADQSIVLSNTVILKAATSNALAKTENYTVLVDTTRLFNSPILIQKSITNVSGLMEFSVGVPLDDVVYYWKVSQDVDSTEQQKIHSFLYSSKSQPGWNQSHHFQYTDNTYTGLVIPDDRQLRFDTSGFFISIHNRVYNPAVPPGYQFNFENFAASVNPWLFLEEGIAVVVGDQIDGSASLNRGGDFGSVFDTSESSRRVFGFKTSTQEERSIVLKFLDQIPEGQYVFLFTVLQDEASNIYAQDWSSDRDITGSDLISYLETEGAIHIRQLADSGTLPYTFIYQKGKAPLGESIATSIGESIRTDVFIPRLVINGDMTTVPIGPASQWHSLDFDFQKMASDVINYEVIGIGIDGKERTLYTLEKKTFDLSDVDSAVYPFLKFKFNIQDDTQRTAPQINYLRIYYEGLPDLALDPIRYSVRADESNGDIRLGIGVTNSSNIDIEKSQLVYSLSNTSGVYTSLTQEVPALEGGAHYDETLVLTEGTVQDNSILKIELNPSDDPQELHQFNNIALTEISRIPDLKAPTLDVTFDGIHIQDGEIISPSPVIHFDVLDEDQTTPVISLQQFEIIIRRPDGSFWNVIDSKDMLSLQTSADKLTSRLKFSPRFDEGDYQLRAKVFDAAANESIEYQVIFKVVNRKTISSLTVFPNPVNEGMRFSYFITGELNFTIHIYSNDGQLVKQFKQLELGNGGSGQQESIYWNGTDDAGNLVPSGVYTYKIIYDEDDLSYQDFLSSFGQKAAGQFVIIR